MGYRDDFDNARGCVPPNSCYSLNPTLGTFAILDLGSHGLVNYDTSAVSFEPTISLLVTSKVWPKKRSEAFSLFPPFRTDTAPIASRRVTASAATRRLVGLASNGVDFALITDRDIDRPLNGLPAVRDFLKADRVEAVLGVTGPDVVMPIYLVD